MSLYHFQSGMTLAPILKSRKDLHPAGKLYVTSNKEAKATDPNHRWCLALTSFESLSIIIFDHFHHDSLDHILTHWWSSNQIRLFYRRTGHQSKSTVTSSYVRWEILIVRRTVRRYPRNRNKNHPPKDVELDWKRVVRGEICMRYIVNLLQTSTIKLS
jgi:hypothetical protein